MSDDTIPEATASRSVAAPPETGPVLIPSSPADASTPQPASGDATTSESGAHDGTTGPPRPRRRRGSRGGRNRRRRPATGSTGGGADTGGDGEGEAREAQSYNEASADRGFTADDTAAVALEEA